MRQLVFAGLLLTITVRFTCGERKTCSTIKVSKYYEHDFIGYLSNFALQLLLLLSLLLLSHDHYLS